MRVVVVDGGGEEGSEEVSVSSLHRCHVNVM